MAMSVWLVNTFQNTLLKITNLFLQPLCHVPFCIEEIHIVYYAHFRDEEIEALSP